MALSIDTTSPDGIDLSRVPTAPGVYIYKDSRGRILYVGKAKRLRSRVASYFRAVAAHTPKTRAMLAQARSLDFLVTDTEKEALLLEASLIKKHRPRYNIVLRDDKSYVLFKLDKSNEYPRLYLTRRVEKDNAVYYGPFTSALSARDAWKAIHSVFPLRRCKESVFKNRVRPCLYYDMGQCLGPCARPVDPAEYAALVGKVEMLLGGRSGELVRSLEKEMTAASEALDFERAAELRDQIRAVQRTLEKQVAVLPGEQDMDVVNLAGVEEGLGLGLLFVRQGRLLDKKNFFFPGLSLEDGPEVLENFLTQFYAPGSFVPETLLLPWDPALLRGGDEERSAAIPLYNDAPEGEEPHQPGEPAPQEPPLTEQAADESPLLPEEHLVVPDEGTLSADAQELLQPDATRNGVALADVLAERRGKHVRITGPRNATEKKLLAMARANAREDTLIERRPPLLPGLAKALRLPRPPERIEAVDVSHHRGQETRAGVVVYEDGKPHKDAYRVYAFSDEEGGGDDYAVLAAWTQRRIESGPPWPDLLLIDGGKGQLRAVERALEEAGQPGLWPLASIAKAKDADPDGRFTRRVNHALEDVIYLPGRKNPAPLAPGSQELLFLQQIRDAVHRYSIGRHRRSRRKKLLQSELLQIPGVGPKTARLLWDAFPSVQAMAEADLADLEAIPGLGAKRAKQIHEQLQGLV
ncbi:excinuclease ABC subunit UvrC [Oceanidesulfovibrio marinus]|uniref:UvrABC system protein C n=1 Tax=Oceanidesulfovibrio marinus TaxID=370038 RepID=A0A6P1ZPP3_9BACT|nr:excinuclease ABC subunit UvrC [Oceanidesulfovibrio marinus]TVM36525.1 excinuclease ABC subunit C [Oceanidesulfovibrio marinus]